MQEFISNITCCLDIPGINPMWPEDKVYILERALSLRAILQRSRIKVDPALLRALLMVSKYNNGIKSLAAIIEGCEPIGEGELLTSASLPPDSVLDLHTDAQRLRATL